MNSLAPAYEVRYLGDLQRIEVKPGDLFVLKVPGKISLETAERIREQWERATDGTKLIIIEDGCELGVFGPVQ